MALMGVLLLALLLFGLAFARAFGLRSVCSLSPLSLRILM